MNPNASHLIRLLALACTAGAAVSAAHAQSGDEGRKPRARSEHHEAHEREKRPGESASASPAVAWLLTMHGHDGKPQGVWGISDEGVLSGPLNSAIPDGPAGLVPHDLRGLTPLPDGGFLAMNAYINDTRILRFGARDASGAYPYLGDFAKAGAAVPALAHGYQIAIARNGKVYASNQDSDTVTCFAGLDQPNAGAPVSLANAAGSAPGVIVPSDKTSADGINDVRGIAFGPDGLLHVCDRGAGRVSAYDTSTGRRVKVVADARHGLKHPIQALFTPDGASMFVSDNGADCVFKVEVASGRVAEFVAKGKAGLAEPSALAIHDGWLYVASRQDKRILRFRLSDGEPDANPFATLPDEPEFLLRVGG